MVLRAHHISGAEEKQCVELCVDEETGKRWVRVEKAIEAKALRLFPGAPKARGFLANSEHPHRATFTVAAKPAEGGGRTDEVREFHLNPEFKLPEAQEEASAVAEAF